MRYHAALRAPILPGSVWASEDAVERANIRIWNGASASL